jgi:hypothetical protein
MEIHFNKFVARFAGVLLILAAPSLRAAGALTPLLNTPKPGDREITGQLRTPGNLKVLITRTHKNGSQDQQIASPDPNTGQFSAALNPHEAVALGDTVSAAAAQQLPGVAGIASGPPSVITFRSPLTQAVGSSIAFQIQSILGDSGLAGLHSGTVTAPTTIQLDQNDVLTLPSNPDFSNLTVAVTQAPSTTITILTPLCYWGRAICYAYFGSVFSSDLSQKKPYLDFDVEWSWVKLDHVVAATFYEARLTQISTTSTAPSSQSIEIETGALWAPYVPSEFVWNFQSSQYGFVPSVLVEGGGSGSPGGLAGQNQLAFPGQGKTFLTNYSAGMRLALVQWHAAHSEANETLSYIDFAAGRDRLYDFAGPGSVRRYGLRKIVEARLKIPRLDLRAGVDMNLGQGQNEVRIIVEANAISMLKSLLGQ